MHIWDIVRFVLTTLPILLDSSTSWPVGQIRYVEILFVSCVYAYVFVEVLQYNCYMPACFDHLGHPQTASLSCQSSIYNLPILQYQ